MIQDGTRIQGCERRWVSGRGAGGRGLGDWEAQFGLDYEYRLSERTRFLVIGDVYPAFDDFGNYRARVWATFDVLIDPT